MTVTVPGQRGAAPVTVTVTVRALAPESARTQRRMIRAIISQGRRVRNAAAEECHSSASAAAFESAMKQTYAVTTRRAPARGPDARPGSGNSGRNRADPAAGPATVTRDAQRSHRHGNLNRAARAGPGSHRDCDGRGRRALTQLKPAWQAETGLLPQKYQQHVLQQIFRFS